MMLLSEHPEVKELVYSSRSSSQFQSTEVEELVYSSSQGLQFYHPYPRLELYSKVSKLSEVSDLFKFGKLFAVSDLSEVSELPEVGFTDQLQQERWECFLEATEQRIEDEKKAANYNSSLVRFNNLLQVVNQKIEEERFLEEKRFFEKERVKEERVIKEEKIEENIKTSGFIKETSSPKRRRVLLDWGSITRSEATNYNNFVEHCKMPYSNDVIAIIKAAQPNFGVSNTRNQKSARKRIYTRKIPSKKNNEPNRAEFSTKSTEPNRAKSLSPQTNSPTKVTKSSRARSTSPKRSKYLPIIPTMTLRTERRKPKRYDE